jgi:hypothetical protein
MRRIFHRFPNVIDLEFEVNRPFGAFLSCLKALHNSHQTTRTGPDLVKRTVLVEVATNKTAFEPIDKVPPFETEVTEAIDYRVTLQDTLLKPGGKVPVSRNVFLLRAQDHGMKVECTVVREGKHGTLDAMDLKTLLTGACQ